MILTVNQLVEIDNETTERILSIDTNYSICYTIDINSPSALPEKKKIAVYEEMLEKGRLKLLTDEPFDIFYSDEEISQNKKDIRDARWNTIKDIVGSDPDIYVHYKRGELVKDNCNNLGVHKKTVYQNLRRYWQKGMILNALLPDYKNSGGKGKKKTVGEKKIGRPKIYNRENKGVNVTEEIAEQCFKVGFLRYKSNQKNKRSLKDIYHLILQDFFVKDEWYEGGQKKIVLEDNIPSLRQFRYWYQTSQDPKINSVSRNIYKKGIRKHLLEDRAVLSRSDLNIDAPGDKYQIDSTIGDVYLVSEKNRNWIIGRPTIYFVIDVFSRQVVGLYVGLENPSWLGATLALLNTNMDKVEFCKKYDIEIHEDEWPAKHMPSSILADQGEFKGYNADQLTKHFGVNVQNTPSYRADLKGIVEQFFNVTNQRFKPFVPGSVSKEGLTRGGRDYRLDAKLTLKEFTKIIIHSVLYHNNHHWQSNYNPDDEMLADEVQLIPNKIWEWGIANRAGKLKTFSTNRIMVSLLPKYSGTVTKFGIRFQHGLYYTSEKAEEERWFQKAAVSGNWKVKLAFDPRSTENIYVINDDGTYDVCRLTDPYKGYSELHSDEIKAINFFKKNAQMNFKKTETEKLIEYNNAIEAIVSSADSAYKDERIHQTKTERVRNIKEKKRMELKVERESSEYIFPNIPNKKIIELDDDMESDEVIKDTSERLTEEETFLLSDLED
jgi:hypothetical protein